MRAQETFWSVLTRGSSPEAGVGSTMVSMTPSWLGRWWGSTPDGRRKTPMYSGHPPVESPGHVLALVPGERRTLGKRPFHTKACCVDLVLANVGGSCTGDTGQARKTSGCVFQCPLEFIGGGLGVKSR